MNENEKKNIISVDGLPGVGKSVLCEKISNKTFEGMQGKKKYELKFMPIYETGHKYALSAIEDMMKPVKNEKGEKKFIECLDTEFHKSSRMALRGIGDLMDVASYFPNPSAQEWMYETLKNIEKHILLSQQRCENEIFGNFQCIMLASSYAPLLNATHNPSKNKNDGEKEKFFIMDRDPKCNGVFYNQLNKNNLFSPSSKFMYHKIYNHYRDNNVKKSSEIWLWCNPVTAQKRIESRGRKEEETTLNIGVLWEFQSISLYRIILSYCNCIDLFEKTPVDLEKATHTSFLRIMDNFINNPKNKKINELNVQNANKFRNSKYDLLKNKRPAFVLLWDEIKKNEKGEKTHDFGEKKDFLKILSLLKNNCDGCLNKILPSVNIYAKNYKNNSAKNGNTSSSSSQRNEEKTKIIYKKFKKFHQEKGVQYHCEKCSKRIDDISFSLSDDKNVSRYSNLFHKISNVLYVFAPTLSSVCEDKEINKKIFKEFSKFHRKKIILNIFLDSVPEALI